MKRVSTLAWALALMVCLLGGAKVVAQERQRDGARPDGQRTDRARDARRGDARRDLSFAQKQARWNQLSDADKQRMRRLHAFLATLDEKQRQALVERLRRVSPEKRRELLDNLKRLKKQSAQNRRRLLQRQRELQRWMNSLPAAERQRLRRLPRQQLHRELRRRMRENFQKVQRQYLKQASPQERQHYRTFAPHEKERVLKGFLQARRKKRREAQAGRSDRANADFRPLLQELRKLRPREIQMLFGGREIPAKLGDRVPRNLLQRLRQLSPQERRELERRLRQSFENRPRDRLEDRPGDRPQRPSRDARQSSRGAFMNRAHE